MKIAVIFGGSSFEHEISIVSAIAMKEVLKNELIYIFCDENRAFYLIPTNKINSKLFSSHKYKKFTKLDLSKCGFYKKSFFGEKKIDFDVALNLSHGGDGEDGVFASLLEFCEVPYIGPRVEASVVSSHKFLTKGYANTLGVKTIDYKLYYKGDKVEIDKFPVIVKPVRLGSSIGVSVVKSSQELEYALDVAYEFDDAVIIEPFIAGIKEYNLAGCKVGDEFVFSIIEEPQKVEFLDFEKKYLDFARTSKASEANISEELSQKIRENFKKLYNNLFDGSLIRCDFFVVDEEVYINEINSIPGSMANYLFEDFNDLLNNLAKDLPIKKQIKISYDYVNKIQSAKGK